MTLFYRAGNLLMKTMLRLFTRWQVVGRDNVPQQGPLLVVANHLHMADPPLLSASIPRPIVFMAKEEAFRSLWQGPLVRGYGAFPVRKGALDRGAMRRALQVLAQSKVLGMFPEGSRSRSAEMRAAYPGTAFIAQRTGTTILPVGITGTEQLRGLAWILRRPRVTVNIGRPFRLPSAPAKRDEAQMAEMTEIIMKSISTLLPESYRGVYGGQTRQRPAPRLRYSGASEGPSRAD